MISTASTPRYSDERQQKLEKLARGKCSAASRRHGARLRWFPTIAGEFIDDPDSAEGFDMNFDAVKRAMDFKAECKQRLAEAEGSA